MFVEDINARFLLDMKLHPLSLWENMVVPCASDLFSLPTEASLMKSARPLANPIVY